MRDEMRDRGVLEFLFEVIEMFFGDVSRGGICSY